MVEDVDLLQAEIEDLNNKIEKLESQIEDLEYEKIELTKKINNAIRELE